MEYGGQIEPMGECAGWCLQGLACRLGNDPFGMSPVEGEGRSRLFKPAPDGSDWATFRSA